MDIKRETPSWRKKEQLWLFILYSIVLLQDRFCTEGKLYFDEFMKNIVEMGI